MNNIFNVAEINSKILTKIEARKLILLHENDVFHYFDEGCTRFVFKNDDKTKVLKLEKDSSNRANYFEDKLYEESDQKDKLAKTKLLPNGFIEQEFCLPIKYGGKKLNDEQKEFAWSCRNEVGWNKDGELVCFDLDEFMKY